MTVISIDREDIKAALRKRHGTVENYAKAVGIDVQLVRDLLRGKSITAKPDVAKELGVDPDHLVIVAANIPVHGGYNKRRPAAHRQSAGAK